MNLSLCVWRKKKKRKYMGKTCVHRCEIFPRHMKNDPCPFCSKMFFSHFMDQATREIDFSWLIFFGLETQRQI